MKITSSTMALASERSYTSYTHQEAMSVILTSEEAAKLELSEESKSLVEQMKENMAKLTKEKEQEQKEKEKENAANSLKQMTSLSPNSLRGLNFDLNEDLQVKLQLLRKLLAALRNGKYGNNGDLLKSLKESDNSVKGLAQNTGLHNTQNPITISSQLASKAQLPQTTWTKTTVTSAFYGEAENTAFTANGIARTEDGREISFGVSVEMSRAFCAKFESITSEAFICTDPLVINLKSNAASVTDQKFLFDLDSDGKEEEMSFTGEGSGFLALDKNKDGKINNGNELFGTKSGNGFRDLATYDKDKNGWIDEADDVFSDLKIWAKDCEGKDSLLALKEAGVGAIYLGYSDTEFSLKNASTHETNGIVRSTGIFFKESGEAGTIQHIDLAI